MPNVPGTLDRDTYGASLGGPIKKNKLFFFTTYEGEKINENQQMTMIVPTASLRAGEIRYPTHGKRHDADRDAERQRRSPPWIPNCRPTARVPGDRASIRIRWRCSTSIRCPMATPPAMD